MIAASVPAVDRVAELEAAVARLEDRLAEFGRRLDRVCEVDAILARAGRPQARPQARPPLHLVRPAG